MTSLTSRRGVRPWMPRSTKAIWQTAEEVRSGATNLDAIAICPGFHPLYDCCPLSEDCPKFRGTFVADPALDQDLDDLIDLKTRRSTLDAEIDEREERIRRFCHLSGNRTQWLHSGLYHFKAARVPGRRTLDPNKLRSALENHLDDLTIDAVLTASTNIGADHKRLSVTKRNPGR